MSVATAAGHAAAQPRARHSPSFALAYGVGGVAVLALILLGHVALDRGWLDVGASVPAVVRSFSAAVFLAIGLSSLAGYAGRGAASNLILGVAFTGTALILAVRLVLHVVAFVTGDGSLYEITARLSFSQHTYLPLTILLGLAFVPPRDGQERPRAHRGFLLASAGLVLLGTVGALSPAFPGSIVEGTVVARPSASWVVSAYLVLLALIWRRADLSATVAGRWLVFALFVGFLNQTLVAPFWHAASTSGAALLDALVTLLMVLVAGAGVVLEARHGALEQAAALARARVEAAERARIEEALAREAARLRVANEELAQYAYLASHDLQEPLRMVTNYLQLIERRYADVLDDDGRQFMHFAVDGAVRMKRLTNDLLLYSSVSTKALVPALTSAGAAFEAARKNLELAIVESGAEVTSDPLPTVWMDEGQLVQLLQNLIANALKFRRQEEPPRVHLSAEQDGDVVRFSLRDNGIGIDSKYADRVFGVFQRLHRSDVIPGSGIGLALCRKIVQRHGGRIWFDSVVGEGTTFSWTVPAEPVSLAPARPEPEDAELERRVSSLIERARELI
jgi:signal transduction histidine kinase